MMGIQAEPARLFYNFCLDDHVPADHILRRIDRFLDLASARSALKPFYSTMGRPSIDPDLMMRMLIVGYCMGIRSERRLCEEVHLNLAYRWFCKLGLDGKVPDHSTFSHNRHGRFRDSDILRHLFETVLQRCIAEGLVGGEGFAVDASLIAADANKQRSLPRTDGSQKAPMGRQAAPLGNTSRSWTMQPSGRHQTLRRSSSHLLIRRPSGLARTMGTPSSPTPPTT
jgi:transposase